MSVVSSACSFIHYAVLASQGKISFERINNVDLVAGPVRQPYFDDEIPSSSMDTIVENLLSMGGVRDTRKQNITFRFGNGEMY
jgi:hypothetical protein